MQIFWAVGTVFEVLLAILVMPTLGWRWLLGLSTIPLFIFAILCFVSMSLHLCLSWKKLSLGCVVCCCQWLPESARYDVLTGNQDKALATLKRIATENGVPMPLGKLVAARQVSVPSPPATFEMNLLTLIFGLGSVIQCRVEVSQ